MLVLVLLCLFNYIPNNLAILLQRPSHQKKNLQRVSVQSKVGNYKQYLTWFNSSREPGPRQHSLPYGGREERIRRVKVRKLMG